MNVKKINKLILDGLMKSKDTVKLGKAADKVGVTVGAGHYLILMKERDFLFDAKKILINDLDLSHFLKVEGDEGKLTSNLKINGKNVECVEIKNEKCNAFVNRKYLDLFDKDCTLIISGNRKPVYIFEKEELVGLILPVVFPEGE